jgi:glutathione synthase/RimK-type ligase-like ATP-grasp enzyme
MIKRLAWVTAAAARGFDEDEPIALPALRDAGLEVDLVDWHDAGVDWRSYDRAVIRSTWDYQQRPDEFTVWLDVVSLATDLRNSAATVRWSLDKHYLADLDAAGVPVTPTEFVEPGQVPTFPAQPFIVKPAMGAGSRGVASYDADQTERARTHVARLHARGGAVLVQPRLASVADDGEWPLMFFGGRYSHAAAKRVTLPAEGSVDELFAAEATVPHVADAEQVAVAQAAVDLVSARFGTPTYARIDLVRDDDGGFRVLEVELVEPSLFLPDAGPAAVPLLIDALTSR